MEEKEERRKRWYRAAEASRPSIEPEVEVRALYGADTPVVRESAVAQKPGSRTRSAVWKAVTGRYFGERAYKQGASIIGQQGKRQPS
jgi:hypothetical protein